MLFPPVSMAVRRYFLKVDENTQYIRRVRDFVKSFCVDENGVVECRSGGDIDFCAFGVPEKARAS
jgi:hypothetical protein